MQLPGCSAHSAASQAVIDVYILLYTYVHDSYVHDRLYVLDWTSYYYRRVVDELMTNGHGVIIHHERAGEECTSKQSSASKPIINQSLKFYLNDGDEE